MHQLIITHPLLFCLLGSNAWTLNLTVLGLDYFFSFLLLFRSCLSNQSATILLPSTICALTGRQQRKQKKKKIVPAFRFCFFNLHVLAFFWSEIRRRIDRLDGYFIFHRLASMNKGKKKKHFVLFVMNTKTCFALFVCWSSAIFVPICVRVVHRRKTENRKENKKLKSRGVRRGEYGMMIMA